jgi:hypothetical protein
MDMGMDKKSTLALCNVFLSPVIYPMNRVLESTPCICSTCQEETIYLRAGWSSFHLLPHFDECSWLNLDQVFMWNVSSFSLKLCRTFPISSVAVLNLLQEREPLNNLSNLFYMVILRYFYLYFALCECICGCVRCSKFFSFVIGFCSLPNHPKQKT